MEPEPRYPVDLTLVGRACLVVGGGVVAARKAAGLAAAGADVLVVASQVGEQVRGLDRVRWDERPYREGDVEGYWLVITATDDAELNAQVARDADAHHVWVNSADDPANCSFILPAVARNGPLTVAVGTDGASPALARRLRDVAGRMLDDDVVALATRLAAERAAVRARGGSTEDVDWSAEIDAIVPPP